MRTERDNVAASLAAWRAHQFLCIRSAERQPAGGVERDTCDRWADDASKQVVTLRRWIREHEEAGT